MNPAAPAVAAIIDAPEPRLGVITVTHNSAAVLGPFIESIRSQSLAAFTLYAVDNASHDDTVVMLERAGDSRVIMLRSAENLGFAEGTNVGIRQALRDGCTHILFLNNDTVLPPDLFKELLSAGREHPIVVPKIYYHDRPQTLWIAGGWLCAWRGYILIHEGQGEVDRHQYDVAHEIEAGSGCCMLVAAAVFTAAGLLDPRYFAYYEDVDFCLRARRAGFHVWYAPTAFLYHRVGAITGGAASPFGARMGARNKVYYLRKNFGALKAVSLSAGFFAYLMGRWMVGRDSWSQFKLKAKAFAEGVRL